MRFSNYFKLEKQQAELDFVDVPLNADIPLFVDPYAISIDTSEFAATLNDAVIDFFTLLIEKIERGEEDSAKKMLSHLKEPNETHLGLSSGRPDGRGVGQEYASRLYDRIKASSALASGSLTALSDCELMIEGIGSDRTSDMTINIVKTHLIQYTQEQCVLHNIPLQNIPAGHLWNPISNQWEGKYVHLPVHEGKPIILIPKSIVRHKMIMCHDQFHRHYMLPYLQAEYLNSGHALVTLLKNGKKIVKKKDLEPLYPKRKDVIAEFVAEHPTILGDYKGKMHTYNSPPSNELIESKQHIPEAQRHQDTIGKLQSIPTGAAHATEFHNLIIGALTTIFHPSLRHPKKEVPIDDGRKRIDITFDNGMSGFARRLSTLHHVFCPYIMVECKNYSCDVKNPEFDQLTGRFSDTKGHAGLLVCRNIEDKQSCIARCKDIARSRGKSCVVVLTDHDIITLLQHAVANDRQSINRHMEQKIREIMLA